MSTEDLNSSIDARVSAVLAAPPLPAAPVAGSVATYIDHTLLKADATPAQVERLCADARSIGFAAVCVNSAFVPLCASLLAGSSVAVCTVVGFPLGASLSAVKAFEASSAAATGASEIDMVIAIGRLIAGDYGYVRDDIAAVVAAAHAAGAICKVIIETALLTDQQKVAACLLAADAGADFVKTSTGFSTGGATPADVALMRRAVGSAVSVKAAGGVRSLADAHAMIAAGANRIGTSAGAALVREEQQAAPPAGDAPAGTY